MDGGDVYLDPHIKCASGGTHFLAGVTLKLLAGRWWLFADLHAAAKCWARGEVHLHAFDDLLHLIQMLGLGSAV